MPKSNITTPPLSRFSEHLARVALCSATVFVILLALLHFLKPDIEPAWRFISEYQLGRFGWLMHGAFLALFISSLCLLVSVASQVRTIGGYFGLLLLLVSTVGFGLAAAFASDPITATRATTHGSIHTIAALLGGNVSGAAYFLGWSLARNRAWWPLRPGLLNITIIAIIGNVAAIWMQVLIARSGAKFGPHVTAGWPNRILIVAFALWMIGLAWCILRQRQYVSRSQPTVLERGF